GLDHCLRERAGDNARSRQAHERERRADALQLWRKRICSMSLIDPLGNVSRASLAGSTMRTMHQAPMPPWGNDDELTKDYAADPRQFLLDRTELWRKQCFVFHNWVITATYFLPHKIGKPGAQLILPDVTHD